MLKLTDAQKEKLLYEVRSFLTTFVSVLAIEASGPLASLYSGDLSKAVWLAFLGALLRSAVKAAITVVFSSLKRTK